MSWPNSPRWSRNIRPADVLSEAACSVNSCRDRKLTSGFRPVPVNKSVDKRASDPHSFDSFFMAMLVPRFDPDGLTARVPTLLQFPTEANRAVRSLRNMTTQLLQEATQVIPNQQLLINVVSKTGASARARPQAHGGNRSSRFADRYRTKGNYRRQAGLRGERFGREQFLRVRAGFRLQSYGG